MRTAAITLTILLSSCGSGGAIDFSQDKVTVFVHPGDARGHTAWADFGRLEIRIDPTRLSVMTDDYLRSILAHEIGHFLQGGDTHSHNITSVMHEDAGVAAVVTLDDVEHVVSAGIVIGAEVERISDALALAADMWNTALGYEIVTVQ